MIGKTETAFTNDIAEKVAKELGMSKTKILYHIDFMTHWIKCLVKIKDVLSIYLPHIGSLYFNYAATKWEVKKFEHLKDEEMPASWVRRRNQNNEKVGKFLEAFDENGRYRYSRHKRRSKLFNFYFTKGKTLQELEIWQNQQAEK